MLGNQLEAPVIVPQIVDGFSYNTMLYWLSNRFGPNALAQLDILRRAVNYRARWFVIPDDIAQPIGPYDTLYYQINVADGSYFWGHMFSAISATGPDDAPVEVAASDLLLQAVDSCTGIPLFQDFANGGACHSNYSSRILPVILSQPRLILEPGLCNIQIANRTPNTIFCQWLLHFAEPCKIITEEDRQKEWALIAHAQRGRA